MRTYTIDQLEDAELASVCARLKAMDLQAGLEGIFWLPIPEALLTPVQKTHLPTCGPYCLALETEANAIHLELLVRGQGRIRCECISFASPALRDHIISWIEHLLTDLGISF